MLAPPAATSAHRLAQPMMQFGSLGGQTPFSPRPEGGAHSAAAASERGEVVGSSSEVQKKKAKKEKVVDPNTGLTLEDRHTPDASGVSHVPVPSPYHSFEPGMVRRSASAAAGSMRSTRRPASCAPRCTPEARTPPPPPPTTPHSSRASRGRPRQLTSLAHRSRGRPRARAAPRRAQLSVCCGCVRAALPPRRAPPEATATPRALPQLRRPPSRPDRRARCRPSRRDRALSRSHRARRPRRPRIVAATWAA